MATLCSTAEGILLFLQWQLPRGNEEVSNQGGLVKNSTLLCWLRRSMLGFVSLWKASDSGVMKNGECEPRAPVLVTSPFFSIDDAHKSPKWETIP